MLVNDPSQAPAHLPQAFGKRIWQPRTHIINHLRSCFLSLFLPNTHTHRNFSTHKEGHKNSAPVAKCVQAYIRHRDPFDWHQKQNTRGNASCASPSGILYMYVHTHVCKKHTRTLKHLLTNITVHKNKQSAEIKDFWVLWAFECIYL